MNATVEKNKELTAEIATAYLRSNQIQLQDVQKTIKNIYDTIAGLGEIAEPPIISRPEPAVSVRASVKHDVVTCLDCGFKGTMLKRHLTSSHGLTPEQYRARWSLPVDHPIVAPGYSAKRRLISIENGLGQRT